MKNNLPQKTVFLVDGSSFLYRAYYALTPLHTKSGQTIQAVYGFCRMLHKLITDFKPHYIALVWDSKGPTAREEIYAQYKATRQAPPSDLFGQKNFIMEFADIIGLHQIQQSGIEADDLMYSLAQDFHAHGFTTVLITSDKDLGQVLQEDILIFDPFKNTYIDRAALETKYGIPLEKLTFYFALIGDSSDNIPGVRGIGPKGAQELVNQFESLEDLYNNLDKVPRDRTRMLLIESQRDAFISEQLFRLRYYDLNPKQEDFAFSGDNWSQAQEFFKRFNFKSLLKDIAGPQAQQPYKPLLGAKYQFITVTTEEQLATMCTELAASTACAIDTEITSYDPWQGELLGFSVCTQRGKAYYIPVGHTTGQQLAKSVALATVKPYFENAHIKKYFQNYNYDAIVLYNHGIDVKGATFDTMIAADLVNEGWQSIGLKSLSVQYLHESMLSYEDTVQHSTLKKFAQVPLDIATEYAAGDAHQTFALVDVLKEELKKKNQESLFYDIECPIMHIILAMEKEGIILDKNILNKLDHAVTKHIEQTRTAIIDLVGEKLSDINLNSPKQLQDLLFTELKLEPIKKTGRKTGFSTDQEVLQELAKVHVVPRLIITYRELFKLKSTYIDALPEYINPKTGRIHTIFSQTTTATGRLSSHDPNLQNIPTDTAYARDLRSAFKAPPGYLFLSADYSQIELRVLAYVSQDKKLVQSFLQQEDIHARTAAELFDIPITQVAHEQRQVAKRINFSILYGITPYGLSKDLDIPFNQAKEYIQKYLDQYPGVLSWMEKVIEETKNNGYVTTVFGRRRYLPGIYEKNKSLYELARRTAINTVAQGTAAEIMKLGMIAFDKAIAHRQLDAKMILQIHDELLITVAADHLTKAEVVARESLQNVVKWDIPLLVTTRTGSDWGEVTK